MGICETKPAFACSFMHQLGTHLELRQAIERAIKLGIQPNGPNTVKQPGAKDDYQQIHHDVKKVEVGVA